MNVVSLLTFGDDCMQVFYRIYKGSRSANKFTSTWLILSLIISVQTFVTQIVMWFTRLPPTAIETFLGVSNINTACSFIVLTQVSYCISTLLF